ncbi:Predicted arabinose efflux permease, MFS family [Burkholderia sp. OK233]|nr:Predicted arabinose efflux permease, MFS family [Burkholderia sp. OK233]
MTIQPSALTIRERLSVLLIGSLGWLSFFSLPYTVDSVTSKFYISESTGGWIASAELLALAVSTALWGRSIAHRDKRLLALVGLGIAAAGAVVSCWSPNLSINIVSRILLGFGVGMITACANAIPAMYKNPEKTYAQMLAMMAIVSAVVMFSVPSATGYLGPRGFDVVEFVLVICAAPFALMLPRAKASFSDFLGHPKMDRRVLGFVPSGVPSVLLAIFAMLGSQAVCWTFAESAAQRLHIESGVLTAAFITMALGQIPAALLAAWIGTRLGYRAPVVIGSLLLIVVSFGMYNVDSRLVFLISTGCMSAACCFTFPYLQGLLAELDASGRSAAVSGAAVNIGAAAGPAIGAFFFSLGGLNYVGLSSAGLLVASLAFALGGVSRFRKARSLVIA